ncbi:putative Sel1 domain-containing protein [Roseibium sp. TrichSKD4]|uniref:tetratricopeptide repeat protein n=1 Tax=Roseibium sp. TrichSKD4 TaxID=744980 RepID=UPI0001E56F08|nr:tetratricopeptide repeat protein [Roseibium sp. TrichSKD4]EFO32050.1 putative Sel1 domain-containing protein [Roseibium sp. TrichSKD4]
MYTGRYGVVQDLEQAQFWADRAISGLEKKARDGSASAAKTLGRIYRDGEFRPPDRQKSESWFIRSASLGDAGAMHDLAQMLLADEPSEKGGKGVLKWLSLAAKAEHGGALTTLARLHLKNRFGLDPKASVDLLKRGVAVGHPGAMEELGRLYAEGKFVEQDRAKALELASKGADRGHQGSSRLLKALEDVASADSSENASRSLNQDTSGKG